MIATACPTANSERSIQGASKESRQRFLVKQLQSLGYT